MTETEKKALALLNETHDNMFQFSALHQAEAPDLEDALCRAIEQHEAFRQEVSDAVESRWMNIIAMKCEDVFSRFIIPKPDPLVEAVGDAMQAHEVYSKYELTDSLRAALAARGLKIVEDK